MVIGIIGAGISGLTAGKILSQQGHEVTVLEKSRGFGGRMATRYAGDNLEIKLDHGLSYFSANSSEFQKFTTELLEKNLIKRWGDSFAMYDGMQIYEKDPNPQNSATFTAVDGMNSIGKYLSRWVDVRTETNVGGLTYIGSNRRKKRPWMINLTNGSTFEADAVIIATPAPQAYGILQTSVDETNALKLIREIDEVHYSPSYSLMAGYGNRETPEWEGIICKKSIINFIANESSKKNNGAECSLVIQASADFTAANRKTDPEMVKRQLLDELRKITNDWAEEPKWTQLHFWKFSRAMHWLSRPYFELEFEDAPLALIGDYFEGNKVEHAYRSGYLLAQEWGKKYTR